LCRTGYASPHLFRNGLACHAPQAAVVFDKFRITAHLSAALGQARRNAHQRLEPVYDLCAKAVVLTKSRLQGASPQP